MLTSRVYSSFLQILLDNLSCRKWPFRGGVISIQFTFDPFIVALPVGKAMQNKGSKSRVVLGLWFVV